MSSIPSSAMPHAKTHDDDHLAEHDTHRHDAPKSGAKADASNDTPVLKKAETLARHAGEKVSLTTGIAIGAAVAGAVAALAAIPYFLARGDEEKPKPKKKAKPHKAS